MNGVVVDIRGMPQVKQMLAQYSGRALQNRLRRAVYAGAKEFQPALIDAARSHHGGSANVPASFAQVKAPRVTTHGGRSGMDPEAYIRPNSPLFNIFEPGAAEHTISPRRAPVLSGFGGGLGFWTPGSRKRAKPFFSRKPVKHPGFRARPILPAAFQGHVGQAEAKVAAVLFAPGSAT